MKIWHGKIWGLRLKMTIEKSIALDTYTRVLKRFENQFPQPPSQEVRKKEHFFLQGPAAHVWSSLQCQQKTLEPKLMGVRLHFTTPPYMLNNLPPNKSCWWQCYRLPLDSDIDVQNEEGELSVFKVRKVQYRGGPSQAFIKKNCVPGCITNQVFLLNIIIKTEGHQSHKRKSLCPSLLGVLPIECHRTPSVPWDCCFSGCGAHAEIQFFQPLTVSPFGASQGWLTKVRRTTVNVGITPSPTLGYSGNL